MSNIGIFSAISMSFTLFAIVVILIISGIILSKSPEENLRDYNLVITEEDRHYNYFEPIMVPTVCAALNSLFEGNQVILNIYAETSTPQKFFTQAAIAIVSLSLGIVVTVGYVGYLAFGNSVKSVIIYSLPNQDITAIIVKMCYVITISGSYVILIQPIFHIIERCECYRSGRCCVKQEEDEDGKPVTKPVDEDWTCLQYFKFILVRFLIVIMVFFVSILVPNVNIMLIISGSLCGTLVNIVIPVLFYNRAFNTSEKNKALEGNEEVPHKPRTWMFVINWILFVIGTVIGIWGLVFVCMNWGHA